MEPVTNTPPPQADPILPPNLDLPEDTTSSADSKSGGGWRDALSTFGVLAAALLIAFAFIVFIFQSYQVSGPSMEQTLQDQDRLIVWKLPRTWARITGHPYIPNRGDVVIFTETNLAQYGQENTKQLIKRVIGLPGDRIVVANNSITVYNKEHPKGFQPDKTLPYGPQITEPAQQSVDVTLGKDQLFVCGDNRTNSLDSRFFGPINADQLIGKLAMRVLPLNKAEKF